MEQISEAMEIGLSVPPFTEKANEKALQARYSHLNKDGLLELFRHLSFLLTLLSAICDVDNRPSFNSQDAAKERMARLTNHRPGRVLDAAVTLLVRNKEVIAGMSYDPENDPSRPPSSLLAIKSTDGDSGNRVGEAGGSDNSSNSGQGNGGGNTLNDFKDAPNLQVEGLPSYESSQSVLNVAAIANPRGAARKENPKEGEDSDGGLCLPTLCKKGGSYWSNFWPGMIE